MAPTPATQAPPTPASYGFHCEVADARLAHALALVAQELRGQRARVRAGLAQDTGSAGE